MSAVQRNSGQKKNTMTAWDSHLLGAPQRLRDAMILVPRGRTEGRASSCQCNSALEMLHPRGIRGASKSGTLQIILFVLGPNTRASDRIDTHARSSEHARSRLGPAPVSTKALRATPPRSPPASSAACPHRAYLNRRDRRRQLLRGQAPELLRQHVHPAHSEGRSRQNVHIRLCCSQQTARGGWCALS